MKNLKSIFLFAALLLVGLSAGAYSFEVDGIYYDINSDQTTVSVTYREGYADDVYTGNIVIPSSVTYNGNTYSVTSIGIVTFWDCRNLTSISIPNSVTSIGEFAFNNCTSLTSIEIPNSVTSIDAYAFLGCSGLTSVIIPNSITSISEGAFRNCTSLTSATIPNSVTSIGESAFNSCSSLTSIEIPNSVTSIGEDAFAFCSSLTSATIPNSVTSISADAFFRCKSLTSITIPNSITYIDKYAFYDCENLTNITIPNSVTYIGPSAFYYCPFDTVICKRDIPVTLGESAFDYGVNTILIVPCGKKSIYKSAEGWRNFNNITEDCTSVGIEDIVNESSIEVYPNPAKEKLTIKAENEVSIFNNNGQLIKVIKNIRGTKEIDISDLQSGIYYIKTGDVTKKLIVE